MSDMKDKLDAAGLLRHFGLAAQDEGISEFEFTQQEMAYLLECVRLRVEREALERLCRDTQGPTITAAIERVQQNERLRVAFDAHCPPHQDGTPEGLVDDLRHAMKGDK